MISTISTTLGWLNENILESEVVTEKEREKNLVRSQKATKMDFREVFTASISSRTDKNKILSRKNIFIHTNCSEGKVSASFGEKTIFFNDFSFSATISRHHRS